MVCLRSMVDGAMVDGAMAMVDGVVPSTIAIAPSTIDHRLPYRP